MAIIKNPLTIVQTGGGIELPEYMSAKNFTFNGTACTGYVGDNTLPEIIIPKSYSTVSTVETVVGAKVLNKSEIRHIISDFQSATFSDGENNTHIYSSPMELDMLENDFPNDCYLVSMEVSDVVNFDFLNLAYDMQILQFPININGQSFDDGMTAFDYIMEHDITNVEFGGDIEVTKFIDGNDYQVTSVSEANNGSGFKNYQNRIILLSNLTSIGRSAFLGCSGLTSIDLPSSLKSIGDYAFYGCSSLTNITIPSSVTRILEFAFQNCSNLKSVTFGDNSQLTSIGGQAFDGCSSLESIEIPDSVTSIGSGAFSSCSELEAIIVEAGNTVYHSEGNCLIETASGTLIAGCKNSVIPQNGSVTSIGSSAFSGRSGLTSIAIPNSVTSIGNSAFYGCSSLTSIEIPDSVTSIGAQAFYGCSGLRTITIPETVTKIDQYTFYNCTNLTKITLPSSVTSIGSSAFRSCTSLTTMRVEATTPPTLSNTKAISTATTRIEVPMASVDAYKAATNWSNFADIIVGYTE